MLPDILFNTQTKTISHMIHKIFLSIFLLQPFVIFYFLNAHLPQRCQIWLFLIFIKWYINLSFLLNFSIQAPYLFKVRVSKAIFNRQAEERIKRHHSHHQIDGFWWCVRELLTEILSFLSCRKLFYVLHRRRISYKAQIIFTRRAEHTHDNINLVFFRERLTLALRFFIRRKREATLAGKQRRIFYRIRVLLVFRNLRQQFCQNAPDPPSIQRGSVLLLNEDNFRRPVPPRDHVVGEFPPALPALFSWFFEDFADGGFALFFWELLLAFSFSFQVFCVDWFFHVVEIFCGGIFQTLKRAREAEVAELHLAVFVD